MDYPDNYEFALQAARRRRRPTTSSSSSVDASGDNVWWVNKPNYALPAQWTPLKLKKRHITFAWGPTADKTLRSSESSSSRSSDRQGRRQGQCVLRRADASARCRREDLPPLKPTASATAALQGSNASAAIDGDVATAWRAAKGAQALTLDLGACANSAELRLQWRDGEAASATPSPCPDDGRQLARGART